MRNAASLKWASAALFALLVPSFAWGQVLPIPGPGPLAPASDSPGHSAPSNEPLDPPPPRGYAIDILKAKQRAASMIGVAPGAGQYDRGASAGPGWAQPRGQFSVEQESGPAPNAPAQITSFNGISFTHFIPPDPVLAAGPTTVILSTNGSVTIRDKTGALVASTSLAGFFSPVMAPGENAFDPRVLFDTGSNRFFLSAVGKNTNTTCTAGTCVSHFFLAVSKTSSPATTGSGDWFFYAFDGTLDGSTPTTNWADFPALGVDSSVVVLTANMFSFSASKFQRTKIRIFDKSVLIAGGAVTWFDFFGMKDPGSGFDSFSLQPALTFGSPGTFFLVSASQTSGSCDLVVWGIQNPLSSPTLSSKLATAAGTCAIPPNAQQLGGRTPLDTGDTRLLNAVYRNNSLWTAHSILANFGSGNVSAIRWVQLDVGAWPGSVGFAQDFSFGADGAWNFYPAVMVDASDNLAVVFARSSAAEFGSARYTGRLATDPANTLQPSALLKAGTANYQNLDNEGRNRWGDYLGIGLDPSDGSFWLLGEYAVSTSAWGTWVAQVGFVSAASLSVSVVGNGTVTSSPPGISCPGSCSTSFGSGTTVTLIATPSGGSTFAGWDGDCAAAGTASTCTLSMTSSRTVTATFSSPALPDLVSAINPIPSTATIGGSIQVTASVVNQGAVSAGAFRLGLYFSTNSTISTADFLLATCAISGLAPGGSVVCSGPVTIPTSLPPGVYFLGVIADDQGAVAESNESNNTAVTGPITLTGALPPSAGVALNRSVVRTGQTITYQATLTPGSTPAQVDIYLGALLPDGLTFLSLVQVSPGLISIALGPSPIPFLANFPLTQSLVVPFSHNFLGFEPAGLYLVYAGLVVAGTDPLQFENQLNLAVQLFEFTP